MFEELGYEKHEKVNGIYYETKYDKESGYISVCFDKTTKTIDFETFVNMKLLKAINEKVKELRVVRQ